MISCITFDIEGHSKLGEKGFENLLKFVKSRRLTCTFFINAEFLEKHKDLAEQIPSYVEVGSHAYYHPASYEEAIRVMKNEFIKQAKESKRIIEKITGREVHGFRAPKRIISLKQVERLSKWYSYDSSNPFNVKIETKPFYIDETLELPVSFHDTLKIPAGFRFFRMLPPYLFKQIFDREYSMMYFHNWEFENIAINGGETLIKNLNYFLDYAKKKNIKFATAFEAYKKYK
jgi:peptidoglycan/xylan/chitin deacetylase (PgdA/CDA1 family)